MAPPPMTARGVFDTPTSRDTGPGVWGLTEPTLAPEELRPGEDIPGRGTACPWARYRSMGGLVGEPRGGSGGRKARGCSEFIDGDEGGDGGGWGRVVLGEALCDFVDGVLEGRQSDGAVDPVERIQED